MTQPQPLADPSRAPDRLEFRGAKAEETLTDALAAMKPVRGRVLHRETVSAPGRALDEAHEE